MVGGFENFQDICSALNHGMLTSNYAECPENVSMEMWGRWGSGVAGAAQQWQCGPRDNKKHVGDVCWAISPCPVLHTHLAAQQTTHSGYHAGMLT